MARDVYTLTAIEHEPGSNVCIIKMQSATKTAEVVVPINGVLQTRPRP